jgi:hypothetical protein
MLLIRPATSSAIFGGLPASTGTAHAICGQPWSGLPQIPQLALQQIKPGPHWVLPHGVVTGSGGWGIGSGTGGSVTGMSPVVVPLVVVSPVVVPPVVDELPVLGSPLELTSFPPHAAK